MLNVSLLISTARSSAQPEFHSFLLSRYGQKKWLNKSECRNISRTYCDLSAETSDYEHQYYAKVKAMWGTNCSKWAETGRFYPFLESK